MIDLIEAVWRTYKHVLLLDKEGNFKVTDLGLPNSGQESSMVALILRNLKTDGDLLDAIAPGYLLRTGPTLSWSGARSPCATPSSRRPNLFDWSRPMP